MSKNISLWNNVKIEHIEEAIKNSAPIEHIEELIKNSTSKSLDKRIKYFIFANNKEYPARQIRRFAYELANGVKCASKMINGKGGKSAQTFFEGIEGFKERG